jgi:hypothetical protein
MQNKKNKDQFNKRKRTENRKEKRKLVETLRASRPGDLTGLPAHTTRPPVFFRKKH